MRTIFKELFYNREQRFTGSIKKSKFRFFIPGINSGVYKPASLHLDVTIENIEGGFFKLFSTRLYTEITLTSQEFDELFEEMRKIKELRDNFDSKT